jgi:1-deoxy-D-xylulose-5-phosphate reductoisomerase
VLNAANEVAVELFLAGRIGFTEIAATVEQALEDFAAPAPKDIADVMDLDRETRTRVTASLKASCA